MIFYVFFLELFLLYWVYSLVYLFFFCIISIQCFFPSNLTSWFFICSELFVQ